MQTKKSRKFPLAAPSWIETRRVGFSPLTRSGFFFFFNLDSFPFLLGWNRNAVRRSLYFRIFLLPIYVSLASTLRPSLPLPVDPCLASSPRSLRQRPPFTTLDMYDFRAVETHFLPVRASTLRPFRSFTVPAYPAHKKRWQKQVSDKRDWIDYYSPFSLPMRRSLESSNIPNGNHYISLNKKKLLLAWTTSGTLSLWGCHTFHFSSLALRP